MAKTLKKQLANEDLRTYDLRHTFATRLVERNVQTIIISELLGHTQPLKGFGHASRITPGYAHATYEAMRGAVESLEYLPQVTAFGPQSSNSRANKDDFGAESSALKIGSVLELLRKSGIGACGFEPQTPTVSR